MMSMETSLINPVSIKYCELIVAYYQDCNLMSFYRGKDLSEPYCLLTDFDNAAELDNDQTRDELTKRTVRRF